MGAQRGPAVVAVGGGRGLTATLRAARGYAASTTAVVATADDSGSSGRLRQSLGLPALGDMRRCLVALAGAGDTPLGRAFEHRFPGTDVDGHTLGNLLLAGLATVAGDVLTATDEAAGLLGLDPRAGRVLPATVDAVELRATTTCGDVVAGQFAVSKTARIHRVALHPSGVRAPAGLTEAILRADQVVLGPGSLYTSILAAALVPAVREALAATRARVVYVCNLEPEVAETQDYDVAAHVAALCAHGVQPEVVLAHRGAPPLGHLPPWMEVVEADLAGSDPATHDGAKLADALAALVPPPATADQPAVPHPRARGVEVGSGTGGE